MTMPRVFFINRFYWPDEQATAQLLHDLAEGLAAKGVEVTVIASHPGGTQPDDEVHNGVHIVRVRQRVSRKQGALSRIPALVGFLRGALSTVTKLARKGDVVVPLTDPPLIGAFLRSRAKKHGWRLVHWVQDIYPEVAMTLGRIPGLGLLRPWRDRAWKQADACVVLGSDMAALLKERGVTENRIHISPNWAPAGLKPAPAGEVAAIRSSWGIRDELVVMYSGNLGRVHDLDPIISLAERLRKETGILFIFIGGGARRAKLEERAKELGLSSIRFLPHQPRSLLSAALSAGDVHLVTLHPECTQLVFPSKLHGISAIARPVLFIGPTDCELAHLVDSLDMGASFDRANIEGMAAAVLRWRDNPQRRREQGAAAADYARHGGGANTAVESWLRLIKGLAE